MLPQLTTLLVRAAATYVLVRSLVRYLELYSPGRREALRYAALTALVAAAVWL